MEHERGQTSEVGSLEYLQSYFTNVSERIDDEFDRSENPWMACFVSPLTVLRGISVYPDIEERLGKSRYDEVKKRTEDLIAAAMPLRDQYYYKNPLPPQEVRDHLLDELGKIAELLKAE